MLKIDIRRRRILELLARDGSVRVAALSGELGATHATIRNDLSALEAEGRCSRVQGGAVSVAGSPLPGGNTVEKQAIARTVARLIRDGDRLLINSGTTAQAVAGALRGFSELHIVTNALAVAEKLGGAFHVLLLGGELNARDGFTYGEDALMQLSRYQADWAILSVDSISAAEGVTLCHSEETSISREMLRRSVRGIIAADHTKVGRAGFVRVCPAQNPLVLVTDAAADQKAIRALEGNGVEVHIA